MCCGSFWSVHIISQLYSQRKLIMMPRPASGNRSSDKLLSYSDTRLSKLV